MNIQMIIDNVNHAYSHDEIQQIITNYNEMLKSINYKLCESIDDVIKYESIQYDDDFDIAYVCDEIRETLFDYVD